ncbi:MAG: hypothetical protein A2162_07140 [Deltaproteobacteria bacterium RBG_13_52_11b]|nr:MAG: hypothetical protein A2162_07140 [Deltaproteobacteria bacterium RBG_13_52_11b]
MELHDGLWNARSPFHRISVEWSGRNIDEPDVKLDELGCKLLRRPFRNGIEPTPGGDNDGCELFAFQSD